MPACRQPGNTALTDDEPKLDRLTEEHVEGSAANAEIAKLKYRIVELEQEKELLMARLDHYREELFKNLAILLDGKADMDVQMKKHIDARKKMSTEITRLNEQISADRAMFAEKNQAAHSSKIMRAV